STAYNGTALETSHEDMVHDAQLDYYGKKLATCSSDRQVKIFEIDGEVRKDIRTLKGGVNSVSWAPATIPGALVHITGGAPNVNVSKKFASGGCDNIIKIWTYREDSNDWKECETLEGHTDWVRDIAWAPNVGLQKNYLASCSQDKTVYIWTQDALKGWEKKLLRNEKFPDVVWRVSWSLSGNVLAVSCGDNKVTLYKENLKGEWESLGEL
ncbi:1186_t:CDS:2, partial [Acaulospora colombiana]